MLDLQVRIQRLLALKALVLDFDGVCTDNTEEIGYPDGAIVKSRSHYDGQGISLLRDIGLRIAIATNESEQNAIAARFLVDKWNRLPSAQIPLGQGGWYPIKLFTGVGHNAKRDAVKKWLTALSIDPEHCAAMGDDLVDVPLLIVVGFRAAPATAEKVILDMADYVSIRPAGNGAVRDFANEILRVRGIDQTTLRPF